MSATTGPMMLTLSTDRVWWMPPNGALHGLSIDRLMWWNLAILSALFVLAHILLIGALFRSRPPKTSHSDDQREEESIQSVGSRNRSTVSATIWKSELILLFALT